MKLFVGAADAFFYPDVMVTCDERDRHADLAIERPKLIVEVLSDSTAAYDWGAKFAAYRKLADLSEFLLIDIEHRRLELYRREADHWLMFETEPDARRCSSRASTCRSPRTRRSRIWKTDPIPYQIALPSRDGRL